MQRAHRASIRFLEAAVGSFPALELSGRFEIWWLVDNFEILKVAGRAETVPSEMCDLLPPTNDFSRPRRSSLAELKPVLLPAAAAAGWESGGSASLHGASARDASL